MSNFVILSDSSCDLPDNLKEEYNIQIIPFYISFDGKNYLRENIDINTKEFYNKMQSEKSFPKTSLPSIDDYTQYFKPILERGQDIICITLSSDLSGSYQSAFNASNIILEDYPERTIKIIDSKNATVSQGLFVLEAGKLKNKGYTIEQTYEKLLEIRMDYLIIFTIDSLEQLQKGGRIGKASALVGSLLNIKPILMLKDGLLEPNSKVRGRKKSLIEICNIFKEKMENNNIEDYRIAIGHADCKEEALQLEKMIEEKVGVKLDYPIFDIGVAIGAHTGATAIGIGFIKKA